jgi:hypothetical protein
MDVSGQMHAPATLPWEKYLWYPLHRGMLNTQSWSGCCVEDTNALPLPETGPGFSVAQPIDCHYTEYAILA